MDVVAHNLQNQCTAATLLHDGAMLAQHVCCPPPQDLDVPQTEKQLQATMEPDGAEVEKKEVCAAPCV